MSTNRENISFKTIEPNSRCSFKEDGSRIYSLITAAERIDRLRNIMDKRSKSISA
jgi:hypothetical protein